MGILIDGYNLMHAVGSAPPPTGTRTQFNSARTRFLDWLADTPALRPDRSDVRVVFDAPGSPRDLGSTTHRGLVVTYSYRQTADDLIETLIQMDPHPSRVRVVSNDGRLKDFARRRGCKSVTCEQFVDWLLHPPNTGDRTATPTPDDKPQETPDDEVQQLLKAFDDQRPRSGKRPRKN